MISVINVWVLQDFAHWRAHVESLLAKLVQMLYIWLKAIQRRNL